MARKPSQDDKLTKVTVVAKQPSRWRAGLQFTQEPTEVEVTDEQLEAIRSDALLAVVDAPKAA